MLVGQRDTDAGGDHEVARWAGGWVDGSRSAQRPRAREQQAGRGRRWARQDDEFVAAEPHDGVGGDADWWPAQPVGHRVRSTSSPAALAERVVDGLEPVDVHEQQADARPCCVGRLATAPGFGGRRRGPASMRSTSRVRLGRPVSGSCIAWCCSLDTELARLVVSRQFSTTANTWRSTIRVTRVRPDPSKSRPDDVACPLRLAAPRRRPRRRRARAQVRQQHLETAEAFGRLGRRRLVPVERCGQCTEPEDQVPGEPPGIGDLVGEHAVVDVEQHERAVGGGEQRQRDADQHAG